MELDAIQKNLLREVAGLDALPHGAYNLRLNGESAGRQSSANIEIRAKEDKPGIDIFIKPGTVNESVHIPVVLSKAGLRETVYNDFYVGEDCDVTIVAGCGIHCAGSEDSAHDGVHRFFGGKNAHVRYVEKHFGSGEGRGKRLMNPTTVIELEEGASMELEATQIAGVDDTRRVTTAALGKDASLTIREKVMTTGGQSAVSDFTCDLNGENSSCDLISRTVARDRSFQHFRSVLNGNGVCKGHSACDSILMDEARVTATPQLTAASTDAALIHEAAIGKIAGEQLVKLMTLGLDAQQAEEQIISGFLK